MIKTLYNVVVPRMSSIGGRDPLPIHIVEHPDLGLFQRKKAESYGFNACRSDRKIKKRDWKEQRKTRRRNRVDNYD